VAEASASLPVAAEPTLFQASPGAPAGDWRARLSDVTGQPAFRRALPALIGTGALALMAVVYLAIAQGPQRILYAGLSDGERAKVVEALETGGIAYAIDNATGAITVSEDDVYRARMLVASDAGLAAPQGASEMLDAIPLGSSRTLEGERLRLARERELMLTIREIDGIEAVRVHLATPERSVFVRDTSPPSASVMLRLVSGRSLSERQVEAIVNLVSASVPGMTADAVRVVDQNGRLLSAIRDTELDGLTLQREFEAKLQEQVASLLTPLLGEGNFSSQVQVKLNESEVTSARESYDKEGAIRSESERSATRVAPGAAGGVPGVPANTPPPDAALVDGAPEGDAAAPEAGATPTDTETASERQFELDREVAVTATRAGGLQKLSVAVAVSQEALVAASPLTAEQLQTLVSAAVGADAARGDQVEVVVSAFESTELEPVPFYEQGWFALAVRYGSALVATLLALLLVVRPLVSAVRGERKQKAAAKEAEEAALLVESEAQPALPEGDGGEAGEGPVETDEEPGPFADLPVRVEQARRLASEQPERAIGAIQRMLEPPAKTVDQGN
jgi:flagellar M-ring protein FliF